MTEFSPYTPASPLTLTLCLAEDSILLNEAVLEALGHPRQVQMLINDDQQMLLIERCNSHSQRSNIISSFGIESRKSSRAVENTAPLPSFQTVNTLKCSMPSSMKSWLNTRGTVNSYAQICQRSL